MYDANTPYAFSHWPMTVVNVMENSDFATDSFDDDLSLEDLISKVSSYRLRGGVLLFSLFFYIILGIFLLRGPAEVLFLPGFVIAMLLTFAGLYFLTKASSLVPYVRGTKILQRFSPPNPVITQKYAVTKVDNVFVFILQKVMGGLFFVSFQNSDSVPASEIDVPHAFWKWSSVLDIEGLRVHNRHGKFSVPTPEEEIRSGEGILLLVPTRGGSYVLHVPEVSRNQLLAVVKYASDSTSQRDPLE